MTAPLRDLAAEAIDNRPDLDGYTTREAYEAGADRVLALLVEHREQVLTHLGMTVVGWRGPYGIVPGGLDVDPNPNWQPVYALTSQGER